MVPEGVGIPVAKTVGDLLRGESGRKEEREQGRGDPHRPLSVLKGDDYRIMRRREKRLRAQAA